jgi:hypothetical protein
MGGFKNSIRKSAFVAGIVNVIITHLIQCSIQMKSDCINNGEFIKNDENEITRKLHGLYLNQNRCYPVAYELESSENYDAKSNRYIGRTDLKVIMSDYLREPKAYLIIECKRIGKKLVQSYIKDGVKRFFHPIPTPKYSSYYKRNIMFGYVVQEIDITEIVNKIEADQPQLLNDVTPSGFTLVRSVATEHFVYECEYESLHTGKILLSHLFFNFTDIVK